MSNMCSSSWYVSNIFPNHLKYQETNIFCLNLNVISQNGAAFIHRFKFHRRSVHQLPFRRPLLKLYQFTDQPFDLCAMPIYHFTDQPFHRPIHKFSINDPLTDRQYVIDWPSCLKYFEFWSCIHNTYFLHGANNLVFVRSKPTQASVSSLLGPLISYEENRGYE